MTDEELSSWLQQVLEEVLRTDGKVNLAKIGRMTGLSRQRLRAWQRNCYKLVNTNKGRPHKSKLDPFKEQLDELLKSGIENSVILTEKLRDLGYKGGKTLVYDYASAHRDLIPRTTTLPLDMNQSRGQRYETEAGDCYQMDWGFVEVVDDYNQHWKAACFAMVCHHCGFRYVEFFPNSRQENLFIGMIHAFMVMGIPKRVLTDNMKSVTTGRDALHHPIMNVEYDAFQKAIGFKTVLAKVAHPFTKGSVERLVGYVKHNFLVGKTFFNVTDLNLRALEWCMVANSKRTRYRDNIAVSEHRNEPLRFLTKFDKTELLAYLAPERSISFDGYVNYEGRRFGVPISYKNKKARVMRKGETLTVLNAETFEPLSTYEVTWARKDRSCKGQWAENDEEYGMQPIEQPTAPVRAVLTMCSRKPAGKYDRFRIAADKEVEER